MPATDYQSLLNGTNVACYSSMPPGLQRVLILALLQIIAKNVAPTVPTDYQSLLSAANIACYTNLSPGEWQVLELALLQIIANNGTGGGGGTGNVVFGNYSGTTPNFTPTVDTEAVDTSNGSVWYYYNGQWN